MAKVVRADKTGAHRAAFEKNKKIIFKTQSICAICGNPVDFEIKPPHPMSPCIDHVVPIAKGGHPSDINNLQLAHWNCNRQKADKLFKNKASKEKKTLGNRNLPQSVDWSKYKAKNKG